MIRRALSKVTALTEAGSSSVPAADSWGRFVRFAIAGLPSLAVAVCLNYFLLKIAGWPGPIAYALVLVVQVVVNFMLCVTFVFVRDTQRNIFGQFFTYASGILLARATEWLAYVGLTEFVGMPFLIAQLLNAVVFTFAKFSFVRRTIEARHPGAGRSLETGWQSVNLGSELDGRAD